MSLVRTATPDAVARPVIPRWAMSRRAQWRLGLGSLLAVDLLTTNLAFVLAYVARYVYELGGDVPGEFHVAFSDYVPIQALFVGLCILGFQLRGMYAQSRGSSLAAESMSIITSGAVAAMTVFALGVLVRYGATSRLIFIYAWLLVCVLGIGGHLALHLIRAQAHARGLAVERVLVVGNNRLARMIMQMLTQQPGHRVVGFLDDEVRTDFGRFRALGQVRALPDLIGSESVEHVIVALPASAHSEILWVLDHCQQAGVSVSLVPDLFELRLSHVNLETVGGIPLFALRESRMSGWNQMVKRALDVSVAALALVVLAPVMGIVALAVKLTSPGPVLFSQIRCGKGGVPFTFYKFRSMRDGAQLEQAELEALNEADGPVFKIRSDPRLTRVGRFIRRTSLDELPQLWNILRGEMSLVGPRPPIPSEVERYEPWQRRRLEVVPGLTGLWQVSGRSELSFDEWVLLDIYYIENWSLGLDLQILLRTIPAVVQRAGAY